MKNAFADCHPLVSFVYFALVLFFSMFLMHPAFLAVSLGGAVTYSVCLRGKAAVRFFLKYTLPLFLITALLNPAFNHEGVTVLSYLWDGNPLTLESIAYGAAAAVMLVSVLGWFSCYNEIMTSDKFVYLFGRVVPSLSLVLSMTLRFVPRFKAQLKAIASAQRCLGYGAGGRNILSRARHGLRLLGVLAGWALESSVETADSMKSRGYGLPGRTAFSIYRLDRRDLRFLLFFAVCGLYLFLGGLLGGMRFQYFPSLNGANSLYSVSLLAVYLSLCLSPVIFSRKETKKWKAIRSGT